VDFLVAGDL
jgi:hypothetical protein